MNFWAEIFYKDVPELSEFGPYTSRDVDFFGQKEAAMQLARALGGRASFPSMDDHTPNTALVTADVDGYKVEIDFLNNVLGVGRKELKATEVNVEIILPDGSSDSFKLKLMHPVYCLISRVNSMLHPAIRRSDDFILSQIKASFFVLRQFIEFLVSEKIHHEIHWCFQALHSFLLRDPYGKRAYAHTPVDPLEILRAFHHDDRLDSRYRELTLSKMIDRIDDARLRWERVQKDAQPTA